MPAAEQYATSGVDGLDEVLGGGFPAGQICLIRGNSGAGKTTLSLQFLMEGARNGESTLFIGTSETEPELRRIAASHGWSLEGVTIHHHAVSAPDAEQTMLHPAEMELPQTMQALLSVIEQTSPKRVVIDSLTEIRALARDEFWYRRQLALLKQFFADSDATVLLVELPSTQALLYSMVTSVIEVEHAAPSYGPDRRRLRVVKVRGQPYATGYHDYKVRTGGLEVFPRLTAADHRRRFPEERVATGLTEFDAMLGGGLVRGTSTLLLGPSGTAKSLFTTQLLVAAAERGEQSAMFVFDERVQTLFHRCESVGLPLEKHVEEGLIQIQQVDPAEMTPGEFSHLVKSLVEESGIRLIAIDSLNGYSYAMPEEQLLTVHLHELLSYLSQQGVSPIFTMTQHGLLSPDVKQPFDVSYIADTVILFRLFEFSGVLHKTLSVYKNRSGRHETSIRELKIDANGLHVGEPLRQFRGIMTGSPQYTGRSLNSSEVCSDSDPD
ncbi:MAG: circadian clock protein KaiC [Planctomycetota bacterium]|nr:MAG: circadian clock protein KaiC [Planctomycetota bacterium]REK20436.1 MAG: circadian clock protein KaiC [Planctomycetota bacterium]REK29271.1 MAG: circadian clock protein KaiC [Planctomycetota bacterium]